MNQPAAPTDPLYAGLNDRSVTTIPASVEKQRTMTSVAPVAANPGRWVEQPRLPIPTGEHGVIECMGNIHIIAGYARHRVDGNFHQVFDAKAGTWSLKAPFPVPCNHVAGVSIGMKIYTFGGFIEQNRCPHSKCFVYDTATDQWAPIAGLARPRGAISAIVLDGKVHLLGGRDVRSVEWHEIYDPATDKYQILGGMRGSTGTQPFGGFIEQNRCPHSKCFVYDTATDQWAPIAGLARPRGAISAIVLDGKVHLLGGRDVRSVEWHEIYDPATDKYQILGGMRGSTGTQPFVGQRDHMGVAVVDGKIHAIAGRMDSYDFNTGLNAVYDPKTDGWSFRAPLPTPRSGVSAVYINGRIVVFGGEATGKVFGTNEAYDPKTDTWEALAPMKVPRHGLHGATVAVIGDMVHVPGGGPVPGGQVQGAYHDAFTFA